MAKNKQQAITWTHVDQDPMDRLCICCCDLWENHGRTRINCKLLKKASNAFDVKVKSLTLQCKYDLKLWIMMVWNSWVEGLLWKPWLIMPLCRHWQHCWLSKWHPAMPPMMIKVASWQPLVFSDIIILNSTYHIDGLMQERHNSIANAVELCLSCINPSIWYQEEIIHTKMISFCFFFSR